jgi:hypothetical protein
VGPGSGTAVVVRGFGLRGFRLRSFGLWSFGLYVHVALLPI